MLDGVALNMPHKSRLHTPWFWLLLLWMAIIFSASGDAHSMHRSSRLVEPLLQWLLPQASAQTIGFCILLSRKAAHLTEYAVMSALLYMVLRPGATPDSQDTSINLLLSARILGLLAVYAMTDEFHQTFIPNRYGCALDVVIDVCGGCLGLFLLWMWQKRRTPALARAKVYRSRD
jgi:VanZ family protein